VLPALVPPRPRPVFGPVDDAAQELPQQLLHDAFRYEDLSRVVVVRTAEIGGDAQQLLLAFEQAVKLVTAVVERLAAFPATSFRLKAKARTGRSGSKPMPHRFLAASSSTS